MGDNPSITYFDADLFKKVGNGPATKLHEPKIDIQVTIKIPYELLNHDRTMVREYKIIRLHTDVATGASLVDILSGTFDKITGEFSFKLIEYNSSVVKSDDSYDYRIKDSTGEVYEMILYNGEESGQMSSWSSENKETMKKILNKGGVITVSVRERHAYSTPDTYLFKLDVTGYNKAASFL